MTADGDNLGEPSWNKAIFIITITLTLALLAGLVVAYLTNAPL